MVSRLKNRLFPRTSYWRTFCLAFGLLLLPLAALAHEDDNPPPALDPQVLNYQRWIYGFIGLGVTLFLAWYWVRRWQLRNAPGVSGSSQNQD